MITEMTILGLSLPFVSTYGGENGLSTNSQAKTMLRNKSNAGTGFGAGLVQFRYGFSGRI